MGRFFRQRSVDREWVQQLPDPFSMDDLTAVAGPQRLRVALSWLYDAIERGRIEPVELATELSYAFVGDRRSDDRVSIRADRDAWLR